MNNFITGLLLCLPFFMMAQVAETSAGTIRADFASSLKEEAVLIKDAATTVNFELDGRTGLVEVVEEVSLTIEALKPRADIFWPLFYDSSSEVDRIRIRENDERNVNRDIEDRAYVSNGLFHTDYRVKVISLDFPTAKSFYTLSYEKVYHDIRYYTSHYFEDAYPISQSTYTVNIPAWLDLELKEFNLPSDLIQRTERPLEDGAGKSLVYHTENLPAHPSDTDALGPSYYLPHLLYLPKYYDGDSGRKILFENTKDLYRWYKKLVDSIVPHNEKLKVKVDGLVTGKASAEAKINAIYYWVQDNIKYIAFEDGIAGFKPDAAHQVFEKRYGDCKGMAILTRDMLRLAGFDARLAWLGTDRIAYAYDTPNLSVDNHMICALVQNGEYTFLDSTEKFGRYGECAARISGKQAMIEDGEHFILATVPTTATKNVSKTMAALQLNGDLLTGEVNKSFSGESRVNFQNGYANVYRDGRDKVLTGYLSNGNSNIEITNIQAEDVENRDKDFNLDYNVTIKNSLARFDGEYYLDMSLFKPDKQLLDKKRRAPLQFPYTEELNDQVTIAIPEGLNVPKLPESLNIDRNNYRIAVSYKKEDGALVLHSVFQIKTRILPRGGFGQWNADIEAMNDYFSEQIVIK